MLHIYFSSKYDYENKSKNFIWDMDLYFDYNYKPEWFNDNLVKDMVKDVDKSDVVSENCISSPILWQIPPQTLSGCIKALILMLKEPQYEYYATACGDNCAKWTKKIGKMQDIK